MQGSEGDPRISHSGDADRYAVWGVVVVGAQEKRFLFSENDRTE